MAETQAPWSGQSKEQYVERLFASIARRYDFLNTVISFNRHKSWRRFCVRLAQAYIGNTAIDVAAGTGDFSIALADAVGPEGTVAAVDFCAPMVDVGRRKTLRDKSGNIDWVVGNAMSLPFPSGTFDCATIGFALRNVESVPQVISEMARVVKPGGRVVALEINRPTCALLKPFWRFYFYGLLPGIARVFGGRREPYEYLPESVKRFYSRQELVEIMLDAGLKNVEFHDLTMGVVCAHVGVKT